MHYTTHYTTLQQTLYFIIQDTHYNKPYILLFNNLQIVITLLLKQEYQQYNKVNNNVYWSQTGILKQLPRKLVSDIFRKKSYPI